MSKKQDTLQRSAWYLQDDIQQQKSALLQHIDMMLKETKRVGADSAEVLVSAHKGFDLTVRQGDLEKVQFNQDQGFHITLYCGQSKGNASTTDSSPDAVREAVRSAWHIAKHAKEDPCAGLADADQMASDLPDLDLYHPWSISLDQAKALALEAEDCAKAVDGRINNSGGASASSSHNYVAYGNSHGFTEVVAGTRHGLDCAVIAAGQDEMQQDYWYTTARRPGDLETARSVGQLAGKRTVSRLGAKPTDTGKKPVVLAAWVAARFIGHLLAAISGGSLYRKSSFLLDSLGHQILPKGYSLFERPHLSAGVGSAAFDGDGLATQNQSFVVDGVLEQYVLSTYSARRLGLSSTANAGGVHNLSINHDALSLKDLLGVMGDGLYINELFGPGVNIVTGDYSRGASGFLVEGGEITRPVQSITLAGNLKDLLKNIRSVGDDLDGRHNIQTGSMLLEGFTVGGD